MDNRDVQPPPLKKLKSQHITMDGAMDDTSTKLDATAMADTSHNETAIDEQLRKEVECGITEFVSSELPGFTGILKKRYTDFLVNEILPSGLVVHLDNLKAPKKSKQQLDESSDAKIVQSTSVGKLSTDQPAIVSISSAGEKNDGEELHGSSQVATTNVKPIYSQAEDVVPPPKPQDSGQESQPAAPAQVSLAPGLGPRRKEKIRLQQTSDGLTIISDKEWDAILKQSSGQTADRTLQTETVGDGKDIGNEKAPPNPPVQPSTTMAWQAYAGVRKGYRLPTADRDLLISYFDDDVVDSILDLFNRINDSPHRKAKEYGIVKSAIIADRDLRTKIHQAIRRIFNSRLESKTDDTGIMIISAAVPELSWTSKTSAGRNDGQRRPQQKGKPVWEELGGEYLHFTLYKENKDTMEVISYLARQLHMKAHAFQFAGTKDRRGVTVQRVSIHRVYANRIIGAGRTLRNAQVGNYEYQPRGLQLGELTGNEFLITLRDCKFGDDVNTDGRVQRASQVVGAAIENLRARGFINYYGLQRFGSFSATTDSIGMKMLQGDFKAAVEAILNYSPAALAAAQDPASDTDKISTDDKARAHALHLFKETGELHPALEELPRKFSAEASIIRHLSHPERSHDYYSALQCISRNLRLIYVHAYQSLVWNVVASERWKRHGSIVIPGDLVLVNEHKEKTEGIPKPEAIDEDGEDIIYPAEDDRAGNTEDIFIRARALSEDEANTGDYSIFDIVLPMPGFDIIYPENEISDVYKEFMASERGGGLDPFDMRRKWKDVSLSGGYRKVLARTGDDVSYEIKLYEGEHEQFVQTDLDRLLQKKPQREQQPEVSEKVNDAGEVQIPIEGGEEAKREGSKIAVVLKLQLGTSQYATMALRELMKPGGVQTYKPDLGGR